MKRHDRGFNFGYWTSKTDHYAKSYPDFSLGYPFNSETLFRMSRRVEDNIVFGEDNVVFGEDDIVRCGTDP